MSMSRTLVVLCIILSGAGLIFMQPNTVMAQSPDLKSPDLVSPDLNTSQILDRAHQLTSVQSTRCDSKANEASNEIIVCADLDRDTRYRLPFPELAGPRIGKAAPRGEIPAASAAFVRQGTCGVSVSDTGCHHEIVNKVIGTGKSNRLVTGVSQILGIEDSNVPSANYIEQARDSELSPD